MSKDRRLGRGLAALLGTPEDEDGQPIEVDESGVSEGESGAEGGILQLNVYEIDDNPFQPRREFLEPEIASLSESLKEHDMLQPILVRRINDRYQLISGERRLRAAVQAGWSTIPARLREADDRLVAELAIVENLQRKDLNPLEKAMSFKRYIDEHECTQEQLANRLKIDRSTIANLMRLLELPEDVQAAVRGGKISMGHARALLPLEEEQQLALAEQIQREGMSVRAIEQIVREELAKLDDDLPGAATRNPRRRNLISSQVAALQQQLRMALGTKVEIRPTATGKGKIVIHFANHDEFDRIRQLLSDDGDQEIRRAAA